MFVSLVNSQIASVRMGLNQLNKMHLRTRVVCSETLKKPLKTFAIYFSKIFKDLCTENRGKSPRKILRQQTNRY